MHVSFKANYILPIQLSKKDDTAHKKSQANFYELNSLDAKDVGLVKKLAEKWDADSYVENILDSIMSHKSKSGQHVYILTDNNELGYNPEANNVLAIVELDERDEDKNELSFIQANPKYLKSKIYEKIGTPFLDTIKCLHFEKPMYAFVDEDAVGFYERNGFEKVPNSDYEYCWFG